MKRSKKIKLSSLSVCATVLVAGSLAATLTLIPQTNSDVSQVHNSTHADTTGLTASETNFQTKNVSTNSGPVTYWGNYIYGLDWYGESRWSLNTEEYLLSVSSDFQTYSNGNYWSRYWYDWDYDSTNDVLWVMSVWNVNYGKKDNMHNQVLFEIDNTSGEVLGCYDIPKSSVSYRNLKVLASGTVLLWYGPNFSITESWNAAKFDPSNPDAGFTIFSGNVGNYVPTDSKYSNSSYKNPIWQINNIIPIAENLNILISCHGVDPSLYEHDGTGTETYASYDVYGYLVDDDLNLVTNRTVTMNGEVQSNNFLISSGLEGLNNSATSPQKEYTTLLDGNILTIIYNKIILINPSSSSVVITNTAVSQDSWIKSWGMDSDGNLYYKFRQESKIYKISSSSLKSDSNGGVFNSITYFDLLGSSDTDVSNGANDFIIYNITGSTTGTIGSIMLIKQKEEFEVKGTELLDDNSSTLYGLSVAIVANSSDSNQGDILGILNYGDNAINKAADFDIEQSILDSKIPSEIVQDDLTLKNDSFFSTTNSSYVPFVISDIDDEQGTFTVTANLYQIPWFTQTLPTGSVPKTITKSFTTSLKISDKTSWKSLSESNDYDFMNMLPSNIQTSDLENLNPFQVSFQSKTITDTSGSTLYPKKDYQVVSSNDNTGEVTVSVTYSYVPMWVESYTDASQVLTYTTTHTYSIFKTTDEAAFYFMGSTVADQSSTTIDVSTVPQLKSLLEANVLPSSFSSLNESTDSYNTAFLQFIDTSKSKGYPISKMNFQVSADNTNGTLTITATIPATYSPDKQVHTYSVTYTGLNKASDYSFSFVESISQLGSVDFSKMLASEVTEGDIINYLINYQGYNSNDFSISKSVNDITGTLSVYITLSSLYDSEIGNSGHGFTNYVASHTYSGFLTQSEYNQRFSINFKDDSDISLLDLKQLQTVEIYEKLTGDDPTGLTINNVTYANLNDLVENLLIDSCGSSIPTGWKDNSDITTTMYFNNSLGTASFYVNIPQSLLSGASSDLNLIVSYTGFVKGNVDETDDNLSFIADNMLENYLVANGYFTSEEFANLTPTAFAEWVQTDNNITNLITYATGEYATKIASGDYTITLVTSETQHTVSITIDFGSLTNSKSLSEYSIQYTI